MAKKKTEDVALGHTESIEQLQRYCDEEMGEGVMTSGASRTASAQLIPVSPSLDLALGGGIREGSWVGITGPEKSGKTVTALAIAAAAQRPENGGRFVMYFDIEGRQNEPTFAGIQGLDRSPGRFCYIQSSDKKIMNGEDFLRVATKAIATIKGVVVIVDSASALCCETEMTADVGDEAYAAGHKTYSRFIRINAQATLVNRPIVIVMTHQIANLRSRFGGRKERVATAQLYRYDYQLKVERSTPWPDNAPRPAGLTVDWTCKVGRESVPGVPVTSHIRFGVGIDSTLELYRTGCALGLIGRKGSYYSFDFLDEPGKRHQGDEAAYRALRRRPDWLALLSERIKAAAPSPIQWGVDEGEGA